MCRLLLRKVCTCVCVYSCALYYFAMDVAGSSTPATQRLAVACTGIPRQVPQYPDHVQRADEHPQSAPAVRPVQLYLGCQRDHSHAGQLLVLARYVGLTLLLLFVWFSRLCCGSFVSALSINMCIVVRKLFF